MNYQAVVEEVLRTHCAVRQPITPQSRLREDLGLDSVGILTLMVELENALQARLQENPEDPPETVEELVLFLNTALTPPAEGP